MLLINDELMSLPKVQIRSPLPGPFKSDFILTLLQWLFHRVDFPRVALVEADTSTEWTVKSMTLELNENGQFPPFIVTSDEHEKFPEPMKVSVWNDFVRIWKTFCHFQGILW
jgi:hypothetical protein